MVQNLQGYELDNTPKVLLLGNGINLLDGEDSWEAVIRDELENSGSDYVYADIRDLPATMQIVIATKDNVEDRLKKYC